MLIGSVLTQAERELPHLALWKTEQNVKKQEALMENTNCLIIL